MRIEFGATIGAGLRVKVRKRISKLRGEPLFSVKASGGVPTSSLSSKLLGGRLQQRAQ